MTPQEIERRQRVMRRSQSLGHCVCDPHQPCPCTQFKQEGICHCAGERPKVAAGPVRLTEHVRNAGCASKISKSVLKEVLAGLPEIDDPRVVVGASAGDDAGVMLLGGDGAKARATILTVDVFCPSVDDPYTFGQIAAANSLSDIYAMGGTPDVALSVIGFPVHTLPLEAMREILRGGLDKMKEAGVPVVGGHSINDEEVKCGFAVVGSSPAEAFVRNAGAQVGDVLVLTKPLGSGIVAFAQQIGRASEAMMAQVAASMASLNKLAGQLMVKHSANAATDVTGFSLLGHLVEIVRNSQVEVSLEFDAIPLFDQVAELAAADVLPGAVERNRESVDARLLDLLGLTPAEQSILFGPETSGGMLVCLPAEEAEAFIAALHAGGVAVAAKIGQVTASCAGGRIVVGRRNGTVVTPAVVAPANAASSCCAMPEPLASKECCCGGASVAAAATPAPVAVSQSVVPSRNGLPTPAAADAFKAYMAAVNAPGALGVRQKKLIAVALSVMSKCEPCVMINARAARDAGASDQEISEAAALGIAFGGAPVAMFYNSLREK